MTLLERLDALESIEIEPEDGSTATDVLDEWRELFPSERAFERRLEREGVSVDDCERAITGGSLVATEPVPQWIDLLEALVSFVHDDADRVVSDDASSDHPGEDSQQWLFGEISAAVASFARHRLDLSDDVISVAAIGSMERWFRARFQNQFTRLLYVEFKTFVARHDRELAFAEPDECEGRSTEYYDRFIDLLVDGGFGELCLAYPMFARLVVTQIRQWTVHLTEFARRVRADAALLERRFGADGPIGRVANLEPMADDTHGDGRAIMRVTFESGLTVVYKPRTVDSAVTFYRVLERISTDLSIPEFDPPAYLRRDGYGWMEMIEYEACSNERAVSRYYQRAGALCCLCYFLEFTDCQVENLIVAGEHPILVDAETVMHPYVHPERAPTPTRHRVPIEETVFLTALLPIVVDDAYETTPPDDLLHSLAGFSASSRPVELSRLQAPRVRAPNTDVMHIEHGPARFERSENVPSVDGMECSPSEYVADFLSGFETVYEAVLAHRAGVLSGGSRLADEFESIENRVIYRSTMRYDMILREFSSHRCLADGVQFGLAMEKLAVPFCDGRVADPPWELLEAERRALKRLDPPRFTCRTDGTKIELDGEPIGIDANQPGIVRARDRIESASRRDMRKQSAFARDALRGNSHRPWTAEEEMDDLRTAVEDDRFRREAKDIFSRVDAEASTTSAGDPYWVSSSPREEIDSFVLEITNGSLYQGRGGIALFAAALYRVTGDQRYRTFARKTIRPVREAVLDEFDTLPDLGHLGGALGIGSVAYSLGIVGELLDEPGLLQTAAKTADYCTAKLVEGDETYDVIQGSAGQILGFLGLYDRCADDSVLAAAIDCGDHLLESRVDIDGGVHGWDTSAKGIPLTGFSHGISGIAYALIRLGHVTGETAYRDAALESLEYEHRTYSHRERNWPDYREEMEDGAYVDAWCHGRTGIGLARLGIAKYVTDERVNRDIDRVIDGILDDELGSFDHLCCGESARSELLLQAGVRRPELADEVRKRQGGVLERKRRRGGYRIRSTVPELADPRFFHGLPGIGYTMLRVTAPDVLPNVLLWE